MIKFNEIIKDKEYRERIIKYFRLPMRLSVSEEKFLSDLDFLKQTDKNKYNQVVNFTEHDFNKLAREQKTSAPDFTMENILEPILEMFEQSEGWQEFIKKDYSDVLSDYKGITNTFAFYTKRNDGKHFVSVDLKAANWQSLQSIIGFDDSYEELIVKYTDNLIPPISKTFRTKITGILGAKKIMDYNKKLLNDNREAILEAIYENTGIDLRSLPLFAFYADEFLIELDEITVAKLKSLDLGELESKVFKKTGIKTHLTPFTLKWLDVENSCVKLYKNKEYEIINISKDILLIFNKLLHKKPLKEVDFERINLKTITRDNFVGKVEQALEKIELSLTP